MGPTASGKTGLALEIARALSCEIISVDSALVYRDMNIGTAKPDSATLNAVPHHLIDIIDPTDRYSAARFCEDATRLMRDVVARGHIPLLAGGTMLYFKALLEGLSELPEADADVRADIDRRAALHGWPLLHRELQQVDAVTAARLEPGDAQRIQRALEVYRLSGKPLSEIIASPRDNTLTFVPLKVAIVPGDRAKLHERIALRFDAMLKEGLVDEVRALRQRYPLTPDMPSMRCVGYRQAWRLLDGEIDVGALRDLGIAATRQLAKRQLTWLRAMPDVHQFDCFAPDMSALVIANLHAALGATE